MPFPLSPMPFPMPLLGNTAVKILFQSKHLESCLTFQVAKYNLVTFWLYNMIVFCKLQSVNVILLGAFRMPPMPPLFITAVKDVRTIKTFENCLKKLLNILFAKYTVNTFVFCNYNWSISIRGIKVVSPLTTRISVFSSSPARRPWCSKSRLQFPAPYRTCNRGHVRTKLGLTHVISLWELLVKFVRGL